MDEENKKDSQQAEDPFTNFMFGSRRQPEVINKHPVNGSTLDYDEFMMHIGNLMESVQNLKPVFQKVMPMVQQIWKKN